MYYALCILLGHACTCNCTSLKSVIRTNVHVYSLYLIYYMFAYTCETV